MLADTTLTIVDLLGAAGVPAAVGEFVIDPPRR